MKEGLLQLLELQEIDKELQALADAKEKYPLEIGNRQREIQGAKQALKEQTESLEQASARQRQLERELDDARNSLKEHEARFAEVTNNREYDALQIEIEACRTRMAECETQILDTIDATETLKQQVEEETASFEELSSTEQARIDELQEKLEMLQHEVNKVESSRQAFSTSVDPGFLALYERIRRRRGARVAAMRKGACGSCFRELPAQHRSNVRRNEAPYFCENCGAILVWDEQSN